MSTRHVSTQYDKTGKVTAEFYRTDDEQHDAHVLRWNSYVLEFYRREYRAGGERW